MKSELRVRVLVGTALVCLGAPSAAAAHATPGIDYRFPLPIWLYALAGGVAVLLSAPAAALGASTRGEHLSGNLYPALRPLRLGPIGLGTSTLLFLLMLGAGWLGANEFFDNPLTLVVWVDFWVGLGVVAALLANAWDFVSPLSAAGRTIERALARRNLPTLAYPEGLGVWPALVLLLIWSWAELVWDAAKEPRTLALLVVGYCCAQLAAMAVFGTEVWLARGELFSVVARTLARFAPLELYVLRGESPCRGRRCVDAERIGCPSCWLDAAPEVRGIRLRGYGAGVHREPALGAGGGTFVLALLATVVYDGFSQTERFSNLESYFLGRLAWFGFHVGLLDTLIMVAIAAGFALAFLGICALVGQLDGTGASDAARRYAPTLVPIAAVYFVSHYFLYLLYAGQLTAKVVLDPLHRDWIADYTSWTGFPGSIVWWAQVVLIVGGHVVAVLAAHRVSHSTPHRVRSRALAQTPLVLLMVGYTFGGLWVLGQILRAP